MTLRTRLLLAFAAVVLIPIALLAFGLRQEMSRRLANEYQVRIDAVVQVDRRISIARAPASLNGWPRSKRVAGGQPRRSAAVAGVESEREYLLDYAGTAMRLTGLSMLQIQDSEGRIISSGHFRNEHGRVEARAVIGIGHGPGRSGNSACPARIYRARTGQVVHYRRPTLLAHRWCRDR